MKLINLLGLFLLFPFAVTFSQQNVIDYTDLISVEKLNEDVQILKTNLEEIHPGLYAYHSKEEINARFTEITQSLIEPISGLDFYRKLLPILPLIANNHTKISSPKSYEDAISIDLPRFPFRLYHKDGKSYVVEDLSDEQLIGAGHEIIAINGTSMPDLLKEMISFSSPDGFNTTFAYYALGIAFSKRYAYFIGTPKVFTIEYIDDEGVLKTAGIIGLSATVINIRREHLVDKTPIQEISFTISDNTGILKISSFAPNKASEFRRTVKNVFQQLKDRNITKLIIDVRGNGGGYGEAANEVVSYLIKETVFPYKDEFALVDEIPYPQYYEKDMFFKHFKKQPLVKKGDVFHIRNITNENIKPKKNTFSGNLIVLLNAASASATGEFLSLVKTNTNAFFIGEEAGGNPSATTANDLLHMVLPNSGVRATIPALRTVMITNFENKGHGVQPDIEMTPTIEDILAKRDVVMEFAKGVENK